MAGNTLHDWCFEKSNEHPELKLDCSKLEEETKTPLGNELLEMVTTSLVEKLKTGNTSQIENEIAIKRKQVSDIKNLIENKNYDTHERRHQELKKIAKSYYEKMVIMIILLVVAIIMGFLIIYYFFIFRKK